MTNILIVDDDVLLAGMIEDFLVEEKYAVSVVNSGAEGLEAIESNQYALVILDWDLGDLTGVEVLKTHRDNGGNTPIIMLTAHVSTDDKELGLDSGANDYLTKPFAMKELAARVRAILRTTAGRTAAPAALGQGNEEVLRRGNLLGTSLASRYEFLELIGEGGIGMVFKARHPFLHKLVAIKMLLSSTIKESAIVMFQQEAMAISRLEHPNIIAVHDFGLTENRRPFMVMEFVEGKSLYDVLMEKDWLPLPEALDLSVKLCDALACAHESGVIHRDIKPDNIVMKSGPGKPDIPKILDFGLAILNEPIEPGSGRVKADVDAAGSPPYMSPEQVVGNPADARSDIYSLGCVIFELVSGFLPILGNNADEIMLKHVSDLPLTLAQVRPDLSFPDGLQPILSKCLEKKQADRYQSMSELKSDLERIR